MSEKIERPCPRNSEHEFVPMTVWYMDDLGDEIEEEVCANCEEESRREFREEIERSPESDIPELIEEYQKEIEKSVPPEKRHEKAVVKDYDMITKYSTYLNSVIGAPLDVCRSMIQFDISVALHRLFFADGKGRVLGNTGFIWIAPSGSDKTPVYNWGIMNLHDKIFSEWKYIHYNRVGGKALISSISKVKTNDISEGRVLALITQDEVSTLAKESNSDGLSDVFEAFAQAYDGQLSSSTTVIRRSEVPRPCYSPMWFQGTPTFLKYVNEDFWDIGLGNRMFFIRYSKSEVKEIPKTLHSKEFYDEIIADLELLKKIEKAEFTDDAWALYNEYQMKIMKEIQNAQSDLESSVDVNNFEVTSKVKFPIHIIKMALILTASRFNFDPSGILHVEKDDVVEAIRLVEEYHDNMVYVHSIWETQSAQRLKHESVEILAKKIFNHIQRILATGKGYSLEYKKDNESTLATPDKDGKWVKHSDLLKQSHMKALGLRSFDEVIKTLVERDELAKRDCQVYAQGSKTRILTEAVFYKLRETD